MKKNENVKNVYELAQERLAILFKEFDNVYVSALIIYAGTI